MPTPSVGRSVCCSHHKFTYVRASSGLSAGLTNIFTPPSLRNHSLVLTMVVLRCHLVGFVLVPWVCSYCHWLPGIAERVDLYAAADSGAHVPQTPARQSPRTWDLVPGPPTSEDDVSPGLSGIPVG